jgi:flagellar basal-body rod protein FlgC
MFAERFRMDTISGNIANANSVNTLGRPEIRRQSVILEGGEGGVKISSVRPDMSPLRTEYDPTHPAAVNGFVTYTNVMIGASRSYEANLAAFNAAKSMLNAALTIGRAA